MRFFIDSNTGSDLYGDEIKYKLTNCYIEMEHEIDGTYFVIYYIPRSSTSVFVATCWGSAFDELLGNIQDESTLETVVETWPALAQLLVNGINDKYSDGALIRLEDFDTGEPKWFLASVSGNLNLENPEELFNERTGEATKLVMGKSVELFVQLQENEPSVVRSLGKGLAKVAGAVMLGGIAAFLGVDLGE